MRERFGKTITNENPSSNEPKKSVLEGLKMIPYAKIREAALANYDPEYNNGNGNAKDRKVDCITDAILYGFNHEKTPQGDDFWGEINQAFYILQGQGDHADKLQGLPPSVEEN